MGSEAATPQRKPLDQWAIVTAAIALADDQGVGALTMRTLAERLGYKVMALYNHVSNKDELLSLMVDAVAVEINEPGPDTPPLASVRAIAIATRTALTRHPWAPELWQRYLPGPARTDRMEYLLRTLGRTGLSSELAHHGFHAVNNHVLGYTLQEQSMAFAGQDADSQHAKAHEYLAGLPADTHPHTVAHVHQHLNGDTASSFELVLDLILDGLARLQQQR